MFGKCVTCNRLGETCGGPDLYRLSAEELVAWCRQRKDYLHLSNAKIAEASHMARGTVDSFFASTHADFRYETIRQILIVLIGDVCASVPCQALGEAERARIKAEIEHVHTENARLESAMQREHDEYGKSMEFARFELARVRETSNGRKRLVYILASCLMVTLFIIIVALYIDSQDMSIGFFWRNGTN